MEITEKSDADLEEEEEKNRHDQQPSFHGPGFSQEAGADSSSGGDALAGMGSNPFPPGLWNPPPGQQGFGLGENSANAAAMMAGHPFSSFLGMLSAATPTYAGAPSGFMDCGAGFPGVNGGSLGAMMDHPFPRNQPLGSFQNDAELSREMSVGEGCKDGDRQHGDIESSRAAGGSNSELSKPECSGGAGQDDRPSVSSAKKRKKSGQDRGVKHVVEGSQQLATVVAKQEKDEEEKGEPKRPVTASRKSTGKQTEDSADAPKQDYIHIRARSGQATNSHSLAERVRREKISERMKFLQDLVPGCSKVIGKAVMLDEIINYVQSLQRQVEFLSMKLSAVNPALDFNIERILSKDFFQSQGAASSAFGFLPEIGHQFLHPPKHSQAAFHNIMNPDAFGRLTNAPAGSSSTFKESAHQVPSNFDGEFHNVMGTPFTLFNDQESNGKP